MLTQDFADGETRIPTRRQHEGTYHFEDLPIESRRSLRVVCIGSGYSGLMMAIIVKEKFREANLEFQVYEKNHDMGGTWLVNRYPGCQCDIPAHNYQYSFEPNPYWKNYYATSEQIHKYMKDTAKKYDCEEYFAYNHRVVKATWEEDDKKWHLTVEASGSTFVDVCDIFINAGGVLDNWKWPDIEGIRNFKGKLMHSANWDQEYDFKGKKAIVIGIGSSGIQILPQVAKVADHTTLFARSETWITPDPGVSQPEAGDPEVDEAYNYTPKELDRFIEDPEYLLAHRRSLQNARIQNFKQSFLGSHEAEESFLHFRKTMEERLGISKKGRTIAEQLIPKFPVGCRRLTPGQGFLESLLQDNVEMEWRNLDRIIDSGIITKDGRHIMCDVICCATGFDTSFKPVFPIIGRNGVNLATKWEEEAPEAYFGITVSGFPNYFTFIGPNSPISNGSLVQAIQMTGIYIAKCIFKLQTQGISSMDISLDAQQEYNEHSQTFLKKTVWSAPCSSWYKQGTVNGRITAIYGGSSYHFIQALKEPRWEDYSFEYVKSNRFAYLGNGMTKREVLGKAIGDTQTLDFESYWQIFNLPPILE